MMSTIIGAETAKLAGLQIDLLQKMRQGQITPAHLEWFNGLNSAQRDMLSGADMSVLEQHFLMKFTLLADLGIITVPDDYDHATQLAKFYEEHQSGEKKSFCDYNDEITDKNFPNPTRVLKPGDKLRVRVFKQVGGGATTSEDRMAFLATQKAIHTGAQGASLVFDQKRDQLPKGRLNYVSLDEQDRLWVDADGDHGVPIVYRHSDGDWEFDLGCFEIKWSTDYCLLCFCDVE